MTTLHDGPDQVKKYLDALRKRGLGWNDIAKALNLSESAVSRKRHGQRKWTSTEVALLKQLAGGVHASS